MPDGTDSQNMGFYSKKGFVFLQSVFLSHLIAMYNNVLPTLSLQHVFIVLRIGLWLQQLHAIILAD